MKKAVVRIHCPDQKGIVHYISGLIARKMRGNIVSLQEMKIAPDEKENLSGIFFMRLAWEMDSPMGTRAIEENLQSVVRKFNAVCRLDDLEKRDRLALFATREIHCLTSVLAAHYEDDLFADIPLIISNHEDEKVMELARMFNLSFFHIPFNGRTMTDGEKAVAQKRQLETLAKFRVDLIGLARYMQIIGSGIISRYRHRIINIHHSFLPAFKGASPYHQAYERGVKKIGASAHFITEDLDEGPIIDQDTERVEHETSVADFIRTGRDIEKRVFLRALKKYLERKTIVYKNKVLVFK